jgi:hypothetical protein
MNTQRNNQSITLLPSENVLMISTLPTPISGFKLKVVRELCGTEDDGQIG